MATLTINPTQAVKPVNPEALRLRDFYGSIIAANTPTLLALRDAPYSWDASIRGEGFTYDANDQLIGGTVTKLEWHRHGGNDFVDYTFDFAQGVSAQSVTQWMVNDSTVIALQTILNGADTIWDLNEPALLHGYAGNDTITALGGADTVYGDAGDDVIYGGGRPGVGSYADYSDGPNYLRGDDGNDVIYGGVGFDDINGNRGNDTAYGGDGDDWVVGGQDQDLLHGDAGFDIVYGNLGNDTVYGDVGNDWVRGGQGDDIVDGGAGNDWLWGDRGNDTLTGGGGADVFHSFSGAGLDRITDFTYAEGDRIVLDDRVTYSIAQVGANTVVTLGAVANGDQLVLVGVSAASLPGDAVMYA